VGRLLVLLTCLECATTYSRAEAVPQLARGLSVVVVVVLVVRCIEHS